MKNALPFVLVIILSGACVSSCSVQQAAVKPSHPEYEISYFRRADPTKPAFVFGHVNEVQNDTEATPVAAAIVSVDSNISLADDNGGYALTSTPGVHSLVIGQIGYYKSRLQLKTSQGDSIKLNFNLKHDNRPTSD